jgi:esterase/lipase superfamily enzyme
MFIITNRNIKEGVRGVDQLESVPNRLGPNELRIIEAEKKNNRWHVDVLPDELSPTLKKKVGIPEDEFALATEFMFRKLLARVNPRLVNKGSRAKGRDLLLFVHGFNNSPEQVLDRCLDLEREYGVEVVAFTWPANGGGLKGIADYLDDKRDAQASVVAFDRVLSIGHQMISQARAQYLKDVEADLKANGTQGEYLRQALSEKANEHCPFRVTLMLHSMGNYLFERTLNSSALRGKLLIFDNIVMCAADVNHPGHQTWVEQIQVRSRLYITINEDDLALQASRLKGGDEQLARLGHYPHDLTASNAIYVDFTDESHVKRSHAYFEAKPLKNAKVKKFFQLALTGERAEKALKYDSVRRVHRLR